MREKGLDELAETIHKERTREYFKEVLSSYYNGNYRSAIVMLYTVTVTDLVLKLKELKEVFDDDKAISILNEVEAMQTENPKNSAWESKLIEDCRKRTQLLESADFTNIESVHNLRHLSAHPVLSENYELHNPSKEIVNGYIKSILIGVLTKPALRSKEVFSGMVQSLAEGKDFLISFEKVERFLAAKYFGNIDLPVEKQVFKSLWKVTFKLDNNDAHENRHVNFMALKVLLDRNFQDLYEFMQEDVPYYSQFYQDAIPYAIDLFNFYPTIFGVLNEAAKMQIEGEIDKSASWKVVSVFQHESLAAHLTFLFDGEFKPNSFEQSYIHRDDIMTLWAIVERENGKSLALSVLVEFFGRSTGYDCADERFSYHIRPKLKEFEKDHFKKLLIAINGNQQVYGRSSAKSTNKEIHKVIEEKYGSMNYTAYPNFKID